MKKKNSFLVVALLIAVLMLGVGYALTTLDLNVTGTATAKDAASSFDVEFTDATAGTATSTASSTATIGDGETATMSATLTNVGESQTVTFTVKNNSQKGLAAKLTAANVKVYASDGTTPYASSYFTVTPTVSDVTIAAGQTTTFTVTVTLNKAYVGSDAGTSVTENFKIILEDIEAVQE
ncbi:MAG: hypothetical protein IJN90_04960 [Bacilli bacterium]|nr:hypothetical protein [Bacilli bacterium]